MSKSSKRKKLLRVFLSILQRETTMDFGEWYSYFKILMAVISTKVLRIKDISLLTNSLLVAKVMINREELECYTRCEDILIRINTLTKTHDKRKVYEYPFGR